MEPSEYWWRPEAITLPFSLGTLQWQPTQDERKAAYPLYVELNHLPGALTQLDGTDENIPPRLVLHPLAEVGRATRRVLGKAGRRISDRPTSFGQIALQVNGSGFRPFVERWGTRDQQYRRDGQHRAGFQSLHRQAVPGTGMRRPSARVSPANAAASSERIKPVVCQHGWGSS